MPGIHIIEHPLIQHKLAMIRDKATGAKEFRELVEEIAMLLTYEVTRDYPVEDVTVETPIGRARCRIITGMKVAVIPILRAGLGMAPGVLRLLPTARVGHIGIYRDHDTQRPVAYYCKLPDDLPERDAILIDPMLATGGSAVAAVGFLKEKGARSVKLMCLVGAPEGVAKVREQYPELDIYLAAIDDRLDENGYIVPGLGDAGDRLYGTR